MSKTLSRFVEPKGSAEWEGLTRDILSRALRACFARPNLLLQICDSLAALVHPCGARFARPNRRAGLSNPVVYFEGSNVELCCALEGFLEETTE